MLIGRYFPLFWVFVKDVGIFLSVQDIKKAIRGNAWPFFYVQCDLSYLSMVALINVCRNEISHICVSPSVRTRLSQASLFCLFCSKYALFPKLSSFIMGLRYVNSLFLVMSISFLFDSIIIKTYSHHPYMEWRIPLVVFSPVKPHYDDNLHRASRSMIGRLEHLRSMESLKGCCSQEW